MVNFEPIKDQTVTVRPDTAYNIQDVKVDKFPPLYQVIIKDEELNSIDLYSAVLQIIFKKFSKRAMNMAVQIKSKGFISVDSYTREVAETKISMAQEYASQYRRTVDCYMQKVEEHAVEES